MSLIIIKEPPAVETANLEELSVGTWFIDFEQQVYLIAVDDRSQEKRVICLGSFYHPFIPNVPNSYIDIDRVLPIGTIMQISHFNMGVKIYA